MRTSLPLNLAMPELPISVSGTKTTPAPDVVIFTDVIFTDVIIPQKYKINNYNKV